MEIKGAYLRILVRLQDTLLPLSDIILDTKRFFISGNHHCWCKEAWCIRHVRAQYSEDIFGTLGSHKVRLLL
jgi:hypothetical protein